MTQSAGPAAHMVTIDIVGLPLRVYERASEHSDELLREFALIRTENSDHIPSRLLALIDELRSRFSGFTDAPTTAIQEALDRGDSEVDVRYEVPRDLADEVRRLGALLDEADEFCRSGDLLTLATLPESLAFRRWFLEEFVRQADGQPPRGWSEFIDAAPPG